MKICSCCKLPKSFTDFHRSAKSKDGRYCYCKVCVSLYQKKRYENNTEKILASNKAYRLTHREESNRRSDQWKRANPEKVRQTNARCYRKKADQRRSDARQRRANDPDKAKQVSFNSYWRDPIRGRKKAAKWRDAHPKEKKIIERRSKFRRRLQRIADVLKRYRLLKAAPYEDIPLAEIYLRDGGICQICHKRTLAPGQGKWNAPRAPTLDHIIPVSRPDFINVGHVRMNVRLAHFRCNCKRNNKPGDAQYLLFG